MDTNLPKTRVMLLDNDTDFLLETKHVLEEAGYDVETCSEVSQSLYKIRFFKPDCLLLDIKMPHFDGAAILPWIRRQCPDLPILICTGVDSVDERFLSRHGVRSIIHKPFTHEFLFKAIDRAVADYQLYKGLSAA